MLSLVALCVQFAGCVGGVSTSADASPSPANAKLSVTPNSVSVTASVGTSATQTVTASNTGSGALTIHQVTVTGSAFSLSGLDLPATLAEGAAKTFAVAFTPASAGTATGSLALVSSASESPTVVTLSATGVSPTSNPPPSNPPPANPVVNSVIISPASATLAVNATDFFSATVQGTATNTAVTWTASSGTITSAGVYTAPAKTGSATITATSVADPTKSASAKVTIAAAPPAVSSISVTPVNASIVTGATQQLTATIQGTTSNKSVTWKTSAGTISTTGLFTAPTTAGTATITATSAADNSKSATATITFAAPSVSSITISPTTATVATGATEQFSATVQGTVTNKSISWSTNSGTITSAGVFTASSTPGTATIIVTSLADPTKTAKAIVTVAAPVVNSVTISPATASIATGGTQQFTASVSGTVSNKGITWSTSAGTISAGGLLTAPATAGKVTVTATSLADKTKSASASVTVSAPTVTAVTISPTTANILTLATQQFTAAVQGNVADKSVTWSASGGSVSPAGVFTGGASAGTITVTATSNADKTKSASATVTLGLPTITSISISPASTSVTTGGKATFAATVKGTATDTSVTWSAAKGSISSAGAYVAPTSATTDTITATSNADHSKTATASVTVNAPTQTSANGAAFPGAQGGGAAATGGRGGNVIEVTNLNDSGTGSLRACVQASGPRTCVFRVGGIIHPKSQMRANSGNLTIAGQTAPGGGIVLQGDKMDVDTMLFLTGSDTIVRYLTCSVGNGGGHSPGPSSGATCIELASGNNQHNVIFDHISFRWWDNKPYLVMSNQGFSPITKTTMQWSMFYEPNAGHVVGPMTDDTGGFADGDTDNDFHHNILVNIGHRLPMYNTRSGRWVNNIVYNWQFYALLTEGGVHMDIIGNRYIPANLNSGNTNHEFDFNNAQNSDDPDGSNPGPPSIYLKGNIGPHQSDPNGSQTVMTSQGDEGGDNGKAVPSGWFRSSPMGGEAFPIEADDEGDLDSVMLGTVGNSRGVDCNGNWFNRRDSNDSRIISQYQNRGNGTFFTSASQPSVSGGTACTESLHDGIPDQWKSANGLSTTDPSLYKQMAPNGYTYLENYMNGVSPK